jgi:hypothetical protein
MCPAECNANRRTGGKANAVAPNFPSGIAAAGVAGRTTSVS